MSVCLSVCLSVTHRYCIETAAGMELFLEHELPHTNPKLKLCFKEIGASPKIRELPSVRSSGLREFGPYGTSTVGECGNKRQSSMRLIYYRW